ncbi:carbohydrate-binding module family 18 protein, partial [Lophiostoma macrostomum CBS 122681]
MDGGKYSSVYLFSRRRHSASDTRLTGNSGSTADHCDAACNPLFGTCPGSSSSVAPGSSTASASSAPTSSASAKVSTDGSCGGTNGYTCAGSTFGDCCSQYGWCGSTADHCANCNAAFGQC